MGPRIKLSSCGEKVSYTALDWFWDAVIVEFTLNTHTCSAFSKSSTFSVLSAQIVGPQECYNYKQQDLLVDTSSFKRREYNN